MKRKHAELIKAWADGAQIEYLCNGQWYEAFCPSWDDDRVYRIKPESKTDEIRYMAIEFRDGNYQAGIFTRHRHYDNSIVLTFDGETGKLKSAEVIGS
jgi:hypothetical protein